MSGKIITPFHFKREPDLIEFFVKHLLSPDYAYSRAKSDVHFFFAETPNI